MMVTVIYDRSILVKLSGLIKKFDKEPRLYEVV
jgi:hypothetical protein